MRSLAFKMPLRKRDSAWSVCRCSLRIRRAPMRRSFVIQEKFAKRNDKKNAERREDGRASRLVGNHQDILPAAHIPMACAHARRLGTAAPQLRPALCLDDQING